MRDDPYVISLCESIGKGIDDVDFDINDYLQLIDIDLATWALDIYERELGIPVDQSKSLADRRAFIKSKWRGMGSVDGNLIKNIIDSWTNGGAEVTFDGKINIKFNGVTGIPSNLDDAKKAIEDIKPAHLAVVYAYTYLLIKEVDPAMTLNQIEATPLNKFAGGA